MQRAVAIVAAVLTAAALAFYVLHGKPTLDAASGPVEKLLASGRTDDARRELASSRGSLDAATADYLEGLILLAEGKDAESAAALARARAAKPADWRIVSASAAAAANAGKFADAVAMLDSYVALAPDDERGLAAIAQYALDGTRGTPDPKRALAALDRIAALGSRVAPPGDSTAVTDIRLRQLRTKAYILDGRLMDGVLEARRGTETAPHDAESWFLLGEAARRLKRGPESLAAYRRAMQIAPQSRRYTEQFALALIEFQGDGPEILAVVESLVARWPNDPSLELLHARAMVRMQDPEHPETDHWTDDAATIYRSLLARDGVPPKVKQDARRNLAVMLVDWKQGGKPGEYLDEAWALLQEYRRLGGEVDEDLRATWDELEEKYAKKPEKR